MGTNIFVEGYPDPVIITVCLPRQVHSFNELKETTDVLRNVDRFLGKLWPEIWLEYQRRRHRTVRLLWFQVASGPEFTIFTDPAWLAVFILFLAEYKKIKGNIPELSKDIERLIAGIEGLTHYELELLRIAISLTMQRLHELGEQEARRMIKKFKKARTSLLGEAGDVPKINVTKNRR